MKERVFKLQGDTSHLLDMDFDASHIPFSEQESIGYIMNGIDNVPLSSILYFRANFNVVPRKTDYPIIDLTIPIISKRMLNVVLSVKEFKYRYIEVLMLDDTYLDPILIDGHISPNVKKDNSYLALQLMEYTDAFNSLKSVYKPLRSNSNMPGVISKLVLRKPSNGFPPIFRIREKSSILFVSEVAKKLMDKTGIKGCLFEEVEVSD